MRFEAAYVYAQSNNHYARASGVILWTFQTLYITVLPSWENPSKPHTFLTTLPPVNTKLINTHMFRNLGGEAKPSEIQRTISKEVARMAMPCAVQRDWTSTFICSDRDRILIAMMTMVMMMMMMVKRGHRGPSNYICSKCRSCCSSPSSGCHCTLLIIWPANICI